MHKMKPDYYRKVAQFIVGVLAGALLAMAHAADSDDFDDLSARIQFDYFTADARSLADDVQAIGKLQMDESHARMVQYQTAYGQWKLAETLRPKDRSGARRAVESCVDATDKGLELVPKRGGVTRPDAIHAELYAMQAACAALPVEVIGLLSAYRANKAIEAARMLQPNNPRVLLVDATLAIARAKSPDERSAAEKMMAAAVAAFDAQSPLPAGSPDWGYAEALARLGALQLEKGNKIAARNSIERALVLAPDYGWARQLLKSVTTR